MRAAGSVRPAASRPAGSIRWSVGSSRGGGGRTTSTRSWTWRDGAPARRSAPFTTAPSGPTSPTSRSSGGSSRRSEEHTSELQSPCNLVCRLLLEKKKKKTTHKRERLYHVSGTHFS